MNPFIQSLESRTFLSAVLLQNFDSPTGPNGQVVFKATSFYLATGAKPSGGDKNGNAYSDGLIIKNSGQIPLNPNYALITHDQSGSGFFLFDGTDHNVVGVSNYQGTIWEPTQAVAVSPSTDYVFSFYLTNSEAGAVIQPIINGTSLGAGVSAKGVFSDGISGHGWQQFSFKWNSGSAHTADLSLVDQTASGVGNDFGIDTISFAAVPQGSISGGVFSDANANGKLDSGEKSLPGVEVYIDANKNGKLDAGEVTTTAAASGAFIFPNLSPGTYRVREVLPAGFALTAPGAGYLDVTVTNSVADGILFADTPATGAISGRVFSDPNANGVLDPHETGLGLFTVYIDKNDNGKLDAGEASLVTNVLGNWSFTGLTAGTYVVRVAPVTGLAVTTSNHGLLSVSLSVGQVSSGNLFGEESIA